MTRDTRWAAERKADAFLTAVNERIEKVDPNRYTAGKTVTIDNEARILRSVSAVVTIHDSLTGGRIWAQWVTYQDRRNTAKFLGGRAYWTLISKGRRIKKNYATLWSFTRTLIS